jgi:hypothetical protein
MNTSTPTDTPTPIPQPIANRPIMPMQVRIALGLLGAELLYELYGGYEAVQLWSAMSAMPNMPALPAGARYAMIGTLVGSLALQALLMAGLAWRKNWVRIVWLVLTLMGLAWMVFSTQFLQQIVPNMPNMPQPPASQRILQNAGQVINLVVVYLLFATEGRHWFRRDEPEHV